MDDEELERRLDRLRRANWDTDLGAARYIVEDMGFEDALRMATNELEHGAPDERETWEGIVGALNYMKMRGEAPKE